MIHVVFTADVYLLDENVNIIRKSREILFSAGNFDGLAVNA
jgi:hypothetical protein